MKQEYYTSSSPKRSFFIDEVYYLCFIIDDGK